LNHEQRLARRDADSTSLADGEIDHAVVAAEHAPVDVHDVARLDRARAKLFDNGLILAAWHKADVLTIRLFRHAQAKLRRQRTRFALRLVTEWKAQELQLRARRREQEIGLVAVG